MEALVVILTIGLVVIVLIYGYTDDYKRDPKGFWKTILDVLLMIGTSFLSLSFLNALLRKKRTKK